MNLYNAWASLYETFHLKKAMHYFKQKKIEHLVTTLITGETVELGAQRHKVVDLARLHRYVRKNKPFEILEFGCGQSTIIMAHALSCFSKNARLHVVEASPEWAQMVLERIPDHLKHYVKMNVSDAHVQLINNEICHVFETLPDIIPNFIYLDGPAATQVKGNHAGLTISNRAFSISADPLFYEGALKPGFHMLVDGRIHNVHFLRRNLKRKYRFKHDRINRVSSFTLLPEPGWPLPARQR